MCDILNLLYIFCFPTNKNSDFFFEKRIFLKDFFVFRVLEGWVKGGGLEAVRGC